MKKIICIILCLAMTMAVWFAASAEDEIEVYNTNRFCDLDGDSKVNAADAETALRIAAGLEKGHTLYNSSSGCGAWWGF